MAHGPVAATRHTNVDEIPGRCNVSNSDVSIGDDHVVGPCRRRAALVIYGQPGSEDGMAALHDALVAMEGVTRATFHHAGETAYVEYCPLTCRVEDVILAIQRAGLHVHEQDLHFHG